MNDICLCIGVNRNLADVKRMLINSRVDSREGRRIEQGGCRYRDKESGFNAHRGCDSRRDASKTNEIVEGKHQVCGTDTVMLAG
eukprot:11506908-Ditylum_brightwellii.AAC.1